MKKYLSFVVLGALTGFVHAESNGNQPQTPALMKTSYTVPSPVKADVNGVPKLVVEFQTNQWDLQPSYKANVDAFGKYLADHPTAQAEIVGYADHTGNGPANATLAQKRADTIASYLMSTYAIAADRVKAHGYGEVTSKARNVTVADRQADRSAYGTITATKS